MAPVRYSVPAPDFTKLKFPLITLLIARLPYAVSAVRLPFRARLTLEIVSWLVLLLVMLAVLPLPRLIDEPLLVLKV